MELLERAPVLTELDRLLRLATGGQGSLVFLGGEAGAGKTSVVSHFSQSIGQTVTLFEGACDALSTPQPLGPVLDIAHALGGELDLLLRRAAPRDQVFRAFLQRVTGAGAALVIFEDVHWADEATLDLLRYLGRRLALTRTLLIATYRDDEIGAAHPLRVVLGDLATMVGVQRLTVPSLSEAAVRMLAAGSTIDAGDLYRATTGNPFFVTEVLASASQAIPASVRDAVLARASRLSVAGKALIDVAAIIEPPISPRLLATVRGGDLDALEECVAVGMLRPHELDIAFRHDLARQAVLQAMPAWRRQLLHERVLATLIRDGWGADDLAQLAHHAEGAADGEAVLTYAPDAARRAASLRSHREAAAQYARALRWASALRAEQRAELLGAYSYECYLTEQHSDALQARAEALANWRQAGDRRNEGETLRWLSRLHWFLGQQAAAAQAGREAIEVLETLPAGPELAMAYSNQAQLKMLIYDDDAAILWGERAIALAEALGDIATLTHALNNVGTARLHRGDEQGRLLLERSLSLAHQAGLEEHVARALVNLAFSAAVVFDLERAARYLEEGLAYCTEHDLDTWRYYLQGWEAGLYLVRGRWAEAAQKALALLEQPRVAPVTRIVALVVLGRVRARRGDPDAMHALDEALALATSTEELQRLGPVHAARAEAAWLAGDLALVRLEATAVLDLAIRYREAWLAGELAAWNRRGGGQETAPSWIALAPPFALQIAGRWREAAADWQERGCPYEAALALGDGTDENALRQAIAALEALGARPAAQILAQRLRALGARGIPRGPRPSTRQNAAQLTAREIEVLALAGAGLRNTEIAARLYLSTKTVGHHISAALAKLGAHTRTEAAREARRLGILAQDGE